MAKKKAQSNKKVEVPANNVDNNNKVKEPIKSEPPQKKPQQENKNNDNSVKNLEKSKQKSTSRSLWRQKMRNKSNKSNSYRPNNVHSKNQFSQPKSENSTPKVAVAKKPVNGNENKIIAKDKPKPAEQKADDNQPKDENGTVTKKKRRRYRGKKKKKSSTDNENKQENQNPTEDSNSEKTLNKKRPLNSPKRKNKPPQKRSKPDIWFDDVDETLLDPEDVKALQGKNNKKNPGLVKERSFKGLTKVIGMDCEMVGVGFKGSESVLARVSIVNHFGNCVYDKYVKPNEKVTDYRTFVSGIRAKDLENAEPFKVVQKEVSDILNDRILVGHSIKHDLKVLFLTHPKKQIRDTSQYKKFRDAFGGRTPSLKKLSEKFLGVAVQEGEHSSVQDAQATVKLYTMFRKEWELFRKERNMKIKEKNGVLPKPQKTESFDKESQPSTKPLPKTYNKPQKAAPKHQQYVDSD